MADASCSSSNAFKGLARHVEQDRSHQQDRIGHSSQHPAQSFRSATPNAGLTNQFNSFQQQQAPIHHLSAPAWPSLSQAGHFAPLPVTQKPVVAAPGAVTGWVNDFQRMNLSSAHAAPFHHQPSSHAPILGQSSLAGPMHFNLPPHLAEHPVPQPFPSLAMGPYSAGHQFGGFQAHGVQAPQIMHNTHSTTQMQSEADIEQQFEDAMNEWMLQNGPESEAIDQTEPDVVAAEPTTDDKDLIDNQDQETELARAAQQLVDSVADNDSEKFKNSEFLALMRRIASKQLTVQGNDLVESERTPSPVTNSGFHGAGTATASISATQ